MPDQFLRKVSLVVTPAFAGPGLDLSAFRIVFKTNQSDIMTPNNARIRVYNLADDTATRVQKEFTGVILQAGYQSGNFGTIFQGFIKQIKRGRETPTDTYLEIFAADADIALNFSTVNKTLGAGSTVQDRVNALSGAMGTPLSNSPDLSGGILPRGKVLYGMARDHMRDQADTAATDWSIQDGKLQMIPMTGYLPGEVAQINTQTGLVGMPEQTEQGITFKCLLNPKLKIGGRVQLNNKDINQTIVKEQGFPQYGQISMIARLSDDGFYRLFVVEHEGDTWGNPWYSDLTCLSVDPSASADSSVKAYG